MTSGESGVSSAPGLSLDLPSEPFGGQIHQRSRSKEMAAISAAEIVISPRRSPMFALVHTTGHWPTGRLGQTSRAAAPLTSAPAMSMSAAGMTLKECDIRSLPHPSDTLLTPLHGARKPGLNRQAEVAAIR